MRLLKNSLMVIGLMSVLSTLVFAVQLGIEPTQQPAASGPGGNGDGDGDSDKNVSPAYRISAISIPENLAFAGEAVPQDDPEILERIDREFLVNTYWQSNALLLMKRAHKFFPVIEPILAKNGIPDDFKYLAVAESGLQNVVSSAGAAGFWQILKTTGREFGLEVNDNVDERYHLEKATEAACKYLKRYRDKYGSWTMAAATYNTGTGSIDRYMNIQKVGDYYDLLLGEETGRYVFRILAIKEILSHPEKYGFIVEQDDLYNNVPTFQVEVDTPVADFAEFARQYEINYKILKRHNPWLREPHLNNASGKKYQLDIPMKGYYKTAP